MRGNIPFRMVEKNCHETCLQETCFVGIFDVIASDIHHRMSLSLYFSGREDFAPESAQFPGQRSVVSKQRLQQPGFSQGNRYDDRVGDSFLPVFLPRSSSFPSSLTVCLPSSAHSSLLLPPPSSPTLILTYILSSLLLLPQSLKSKNMPFLKTASSV